jgi:hypothetical protein
MIPGEFLVFQQEKSQHQAHDADDQAQTHRADALDGQARVLVEDQLETLGQQHHPQGQLHAADGALGGVLADDLDQAG